MLWGSPKMPLMAIFMGKMMISSWSTIISSYFIGGFLIIFRSRQGATSVETQQQATTAGWQREFIHLGAAYQFVHNSLVKFPIFCDSNPDVFRRLFHMLKKHLREFPAGFSSSEKILLKYKWPVTNPPVFIKINQGQVMPRAQLLSSRTQSSARRSSPRRRRRFSPPRGPRGPRGPQGGWELQTCPWKLQTCPKIWRFLLLLLQQQQHQHVEISWSIPRL